MPRIVDGAILPGIGRTNAESHQEKCPLCRQRRRRQDQDALRQRPPSALQGGGGQVGVFRWKRPALEEGKNPPTPPRPSLRLEGGEGAKREGGAVGATLVTKLTRAGSGSQQENRDLQSSCRRRSSWHRRHRRRDRCRSGRRRCRTQRPVARRSGRRCHDRPSSGPWNVPENAPAVVPSPPTRCAAKRAIRRAVESVGMRVVDSSQLH